MENLNFNIYEDFKCNRYTHFDEIVYDIKNGTYHKTIIPYLKKFSEEGKNRRNKEIKE